MVRKIQSGEYLPRIGCMTAQERAEYLNRVGDWLSSGGRMLTARGEVSEARMQSVLQVCSGWNDAECAAFEEGALLMSALVNVADTRLPDLLYAISAKRSIKRMYEVLWEVEEKGVTVSAKEARIQEAGNSVRPATEQDVKIASRAIGIAEEEKAGTGGTSKEVAAEGTARATQPVGAPVRPRHIDQYAHLLPQKTQERAAQVKGLLRDLDEAREKARLLMEAGEHSDKIELWARKATRLDSAVKSIYKELDSEWDKLVGQGRVVVDDLGNAHVVESEELRVKSEESAAAQELTSEQRARRRELRKFLTDTRRGNGKTREEHVAKWQEAWKEYLTLEPQEAAMKDEKILAAMEHYGIEI